MSCCQPSAINPAFFVYPDRAVTTGLHSVRQATSNTQVNRGFGAVR
ncbi:hypothetical protein K9N68_35025 (plasmid) [Kovacikia minuta CCNUW1]|nr:hypothetical protein [Kovacikia minuta]UBF30413.1 hypothetical protein K9N68_35025 [Kovacikia minuta CCNUW1]